MEEAWRNLLGSDDFGKSLVTPDEIDNVVSLFIESKIDPEKFSGNLHALLTEGMPSIFGKKNSLPMTPSIKKIISPIDRPFKVPLWFLAGFPDVLDWSRKIQNEILNSSVDEDEKTKARTELFGIDLDCPKGADEKYYTDSDGYMRTRYYRNLVYNYIKETGKPLEVEVDKGSENDIYLGEDSLQMTGEESNFTLIASMTTKYYMELKKTYGTSFPDETSLLAMSGIIDANVYVFETQQITPAQIIELAKVTEGKQNRILEFLIQFESLLLSVDTPDLSPNEVLSACQDQAEAIHSVILQTMESYSSEPEIVSVVRTVMLSSQFGQLRQTVGVQKKSLLSKFKERLFG